MTSGSKTCVHPLALSLVLSSLILTSPILASPNQGSAPISASASARAETAPAQTGALIAAIGRQPPARTTFAEARFMHVLDRPLVVTGELAWLGGDKLERKVDGAHPETVTITGGEVIQQREGKKPRSFSLKRAPQLQGLADSFVALLGGDAAQLQQVFAIQREGDAPGAWSLTLTPHDPKIAATVASIRIDGHGDEPRCMTMREADGDVAIDLLGAALAARMPAMPTPEALTALCQAAP